MLILRSAPPSPFGRKIVIAAAVLGFSEQIQIIVADTLDPADELRRQNPLGKIPVLILENGEAVYDSRVIAEYLDGLAGGGKLIPAAGKDRLRVLTLQALADGMMEAAVLQVFEIRWREPELRSIKWTKYQAEKVARALSAAEQAPPASSARDIGAIALACALGYLDLRFEGAWRAGNPKLTSWLESFAAGVPAFEATRVKA